MTGWAVGVPGSSILRTDLLPGLLFSTHRRCGKPTRLQYTGGLTEQSGEDSLAE